jgi:uncharacterized alpha-E superfamily protein
MLSRVADSIYWMARYMERAENLARLVLSTQNLMLDAGSGAADASQFWQPLLLATGDEESYAALHQDTTGPRVTEFLTLRADNPNSILNSIRAARENARTVRDQISDELWLCINDLRLFVESADARALLVHQSAAFYERVLLGSYQFKGIAGSTTPRGEEWHFLHLGTVLERADKVSRLLDTCSALPVEIATGPGSLPLRWAALLRSCSAWHAFQTVSAKLDPVKIIEYLLLDETFPRSVTHCLNEVHATLIALSGHGTMGDMRQPVRLAGRLAADLRFATVQEVLEAGLHYFVDDLQTRLNQIGTSIFDTFVLYADLTPVACPYPAPWQPGAWNTTASGDLLIQQQQQQQQQ